VSDTNDLHEAHIPIRRELYVKGNNDGRLCKHCCSGKAIAITVMSVGSLRYPA
jgi:hypothetical protein